MSALLEDAGLAKEVSIVVEQSTDIHVYQEQDLKELVTAEVSESIDTLFIEMGFLIERRWYPRGQSLPVLHEGKSVRAVFSGPVLSVRAVMTTADSARVHEGEIGNAGKIATELNEELAKLLPEQARSWPVAPVWDTFNRQWEFRFNVVLREGTGDFEGEYKEMFTANPPAVPPDFAMPTGLSPDGQRAWEVIVRLLAQNDDLKSGGHTHVFCAPEQSQEYGRDSELVVVHDGGSHAPYFNSDYEAYILNSRMELALRKAGLYPQRLTSASTAIYKLGQEDEGNEYQQALEKDIARREQAPNPELDALIQAAKRHGGVEEGLDDDVSGKDLVGPEYLEIAVTMLKQAGLIVEPQFYTWKRGNEIWIETWVPPTEQFPWATNQELWEPPKDLMLPLAKQISQAIGKPVVPNMSFQPTDQSWKINWAIKLGPGEFDESSEFSELGQPEDKLQRITLLFHNTGLHITSTVEEPKDEGWGDLGTPKRVISTYLQPSGDKPWSRDAMGSQGLADFCRGVASSLGEILETMDVDWTSRFDSQVGSWNITWFIGDASITKHRVVEAFGDLEAKHNVVAEAGEDNWKELVPDHTDRTEVYRVMAEHGIVGVMSRAYRAGDPGPETYIMFFGSWKPKVTWEGPGGAAELGMSIRQELQRLGIRHDHIGFYHDFASGQVEVSIYRGELGESVNSNVEAIVQEAIEGEEHGLGKELANPAKEAAKQVGQYLASTGEVAGGEFTDEGMHRALQGSGYDLSTLTDMGLVHRTISGGYGFEDPVLIAATAYGNDVEFGVFPAESIQQEALDDADTGMGKDLQGFDPATAAKALLASKGFVKVKTFMNYGDYGDWLVVWGQSKQGVHMMNRGLMEEELLHVTKAKRVTSNYENKGNGWVKYGFNIFMKEQAIYPRELPQDPDELQQEGSEDFGLGKELQSSEDHVKAQQVLISLGFKDVKTFEHQSNYLWATGITDQASPQLVSRAEHELKDALKAHSVAGGLPEMPDKSWKPGQPIKYSFAIYRQGNVTHPTYEALTMLVAAGAVVRKCVEEGTWLKVTGEWPDGEFSVKLPLQEAPGEFKDVYAPMLPIDAIESIIHEGGVTKLVRTSERQTTFDWKKTRQVPAVVIEWEGTLDPAMADQAGYPTHTPEGRPIEVADLVHAQHIGWKIKEVPGVLSAHVDTLPVTDHANRTRTVRFFVVFEEPTKASSERASYERRMREGREEVGMVKEVGIPWDARQTLLSLGFGEGSSPDVMSDEEATWPGQTPAEHEQTMGGVNKFGDRDMATREYGRTHWTKSFNAGGTSVMVTFWENWHKDAYDWVHLEVSYRPERMARWHKPGEYFNIEQITVPNKRIGDVATRLDQYFTNATEQEASQWSPVVNLNTMRRVNVSLDDIVKNLVQEDTSSDVDALIASVIGEDSQEGDDNRVAIVGVFRKKDKGYEVLVCKREVDPEAGKWCVPGGHAKEGESIEVGAKREMKEETHLDLEELVFIKKMPNETREAMVYVYGTMMPEGDKAKAGDDAEKIKWVPIDDLPELAFDNNELVGEIASKMKLGEPRYGDDGSQDYTDDPGGKKQAALAESKQSKKGFLIVFEGIDGAGKTTQVKRLSDWLNDHGYSFVTTKWNSSKLLSDVLWKAKKKKSLTPMLFSLMHASDMHLRYEKLILPALAEDKVVICDRYYYTSYVRDQIRDIDPELLDFVYDDFREPDLVFHCVVPTRIAVERLLKERGVGYYSSGQDVGYGVKGREASAMKYEQDMADRYVKLFKGMPNVVDLETDRTIKDIAKDIKKEVRKLLKMEPLGEGLEDAGLPKELGPTHDWFVVPQQHPDLAGGVMVLHSKSSEMIISVRPGPEGYSFTLALPGSVISVLSNQQFDSDDQATQAAVQWAEANPTVQRRRDNPGDIQEAVDPSDSWKEVVSDWGNHDQQSTWTKWSGEVVTSRSFRRENVLLEILLVTQAHDLPRVGPNQFQFAVYRYFEERHYRQLVTAEVFNVQGWDAAIIAGEKWADQKIVEHRLLESVPCEILERAESLRQQLNEGQESVVFTKISDDLLPALEVAMKAAFPGQSNWVFGYCMQYGDPELSIVAVDGDQRVIGFYILGDRDVLTGTRRMEPTEDLAPYQGKKGVEGIALGVIPEVRGKGIGNRLKDYPKHLGFDYVWGLQLAELNNLQHWLKRRRLVAKSKEMYATLQDFK